MLKKLSRLSCSEVDIHRLFDVDIQNQVHGYLLVSTFMGVLRSNHCIGRSIKYNTSVCLSVCLSIYLKFAIVTGRMEFKYNNLSVYLSVRLSVNSYISIDKHLHSVCLSFLLPTFSPCSSVPVLKIHGLRSCILCHRCKASAKTAEYT